MIQLRHVLVGSDVLAITENSDRITHLEYFFHAVGDVEHHSAFVTQPFDDALELTDLLYREAAGGFIKGNNLGVAQQGATNFDHLLLADGEVAHLGRGMDLPLTQIGQYCQCFLAQLTAVYKSSPCGQLP